MPQQSWQVFFEPRTERFHVLPVNEAMDIIFPHMPSIYCICKPELNGQTLVHFELNSLYNRISKKIK